MDFERRRDLAVLLLEKLKVIEACGIHRLELYSFPETKLLQVVLKGSAHEKPLELGTVEISHHYTLSDLRIIIRKELEFEEVPRNFRIFYRNNICAIRQEPFRRAWELLPKCYIVAKAIAEVVVKEELSLATSPTSKKTKKKKEVDKNKLKPGQRRVLGKLVPVPISTLCQVKENSGVIYFLHDSRNFIAPGDVIRIGNVLGRDYIVMDPGNNEINTYPKTVKIEPVYDLLEEEDFDVPLQGNFPFPSNAGMLQGVIPLLRPPTELGFEYETLDDEKSIDIDDSVSKQSDAKEKVRNRSIQSVLTEFSQEEEKLMVGGKLEGNLINGTSQGLTRKKRVDQTFHDCWLWKCIPPKEDHRPKWRQLYDDGMVRYRYTHSYSDKYEMHFRVKAMHNYLEVLCTDARCDSLTLHKQRVNEMSNILVDFYTEVAFDRMTDWNPSYKKGIERSKFIKLMRDVEAFPDLKRPARIAQLDMLFMREAKGEFGIVQKFIMYQGFCRLLQDVALLRFPQQKKMNVTTDSSNGKEDGGALEDDEQSLAESITSIGSVSMKSSKSTITAENKKGRFAQILKTNKNDTPSVLQNAKTDKQTAAAAKAVEKALAGIDPTHKAYAYEKFVTDFVMTYGDWYESAWDVAKFAAMKKEAIPYCAATRIQAKFRGGFWHHSYFQYRINLIKLQANIRRKLSAKKTKYYYDLLLQDWIFRERYYGALLMQSVIRRFLKRCWYTKVMEKVKLQQVQVQKARRFKLKKLKKLHKKGVIYKEAKRVNGVMVFIKVTRKDSRNFTRDYGVNIEVYTPTSQSQYVFLVEEADLRSYMQLELEVPALTVGELLDVRNLKRVVASRLMIYKPNFKHALPQVLFSKHGLGVRGEKSLTRGKMIEGELFVCKIFETGDDVTIQCYHRLSCKVFKTSMGTAEVRDWIIEEHKINAIDELERDKEPLVLRPDQKKSYYNWLLNHLAIDTRQGTFRVLFARQLMRSQKLEMIIKIQSVWRRALVRPTIVSLLDQFMLKVKVSGDDWTSYYLNLKTGASSWDKPFLLGPLDLPTEPSRRWVPIYFYNLDGNLEKQYVNPYTGKYTALTPREAAVRIQRLARNFLLKPISMSLEEFKKAAHIFRNAAKEYEEVNPKKLKTVINYALVMHLILLDEPAAKPLYAEAVDLSESNPLVTRSFAFYLLGTCESPLKVNRDRAAILLGDAYRKDPTHSRFQVAYCMFKFACLRKPKDTRTLLNLALVHCMIYEENHIAEKLLRRALAIAPFDMRVMEIWNFLKERFPERQLIYNPVSRVNKIVANVQGKKRVVHGRPVVEDSQWAGWCYVPEDTYAASKYYKDVPYWYNPADGTELIEQPDFAEQWIVRKNRSEFIVDESGLEQYYDPLTAVYFQYHPLTDTYQ